MKLAEFNDLCHREYASDRGIVTRLALGPDEYAELTADILAEGVTVMNPGGIPDGPAGARLTEITNPATTGGPGHPTPVSIGCVIITPDDGGFTGRAEVTRYVPIRAPIPPEPAPGGVTLEPREHRYPVGGILVVGSEPVTP